MVTKLGRPRDERGERQPNGDRRRRDAVFHTETQFQRLKQVAASLGMDPAATSQAGRLWMLGLLTSRHMATISYIAGVYAAYEKHVGKGATRRLRSPSYEPSTNRTERLDETFEQEGDALIAKAEFEQLQALIPPYPSEARKILEDLCVDDMMIPSRFVKDLAVLLNMIEECRSGERSAIKLTRGNLPLRRRTAKALTREEKFGAGAYAAPGKPKPTTPAELAEASRDHEGLIRTLRARQAQSEGLTP